MSEISSPPPALDEAHRQDVYIVADHVWRFSDADLRPSRGPTRLGDYDEGFPGGWQYGAQVYNPEFLPAYVVALNARLGELHLPSQAVAVHQHPGWVGIYARRKS